VNLTLLALIEVVLLAAAGIGAYRVVGRIGRGARKLVVMASMAVWLLLFGMVPFFIFAVALPAGRAGHPGAGPFETVVLNLVPFALALSPVLGAIQGVALTSASS
jgi:hypothetical protein